MAIITKNRKDLRSFFVKNAIPTEGNFADLVDGQLNQADDGVFKLAGEPLSVVAAGGEQKRVLRLYSNYPAANPDWMICLNPAQDPANPATNRTGFGIADGTGKTRLFIDPAGNLGIGTTSPAANLHVAGSFYAPGSLVQVVTSALTADLGPGANDEWSTNLVTLTITPKFAGSRILVRLNTHLGLSKIEPADPHTAGYVRIMAGQQRLLGQEYSTGKSTAPEPFRYLWSANFSLGTPIP